MKKLTSLIVFLVSIFILTSCEPETVEDSCNCYSVTYEIFDNNQSETSELIEVNRTFVGCSTNSSVFQEIDGTLYNIKTECNL